MSGSVVASPSRKLFARQLSRSCNEDGTLDLKRLEGLVASAYAEHENDRLRTELNTRLMADELNAANAALQRSVTELQRHTLRFELALDNMANGLMLFDRNGRVVVCNRRQRELLKLRADDVQPGRSLEELLRASPVLSEEAVVARLQLAADRVEAEHDQALLDGRTLRVVFRPTDDGGFLSSCEDVTERHRDAARIAFLAYHDALTELPNRALLHEELARALRRGACAVLCLDLDGFKPVNDTLGHAGGDAVLRAVAKRLRHHVREGEVLARLGGDEFAVVITGGTALATQVAARIIEVIGAPFEVDGRIVHIGISVGIAAAPDHGQTADDLLQHADLALYCAKADGRGCCRTFDVEMNGALQSRRNLEQDMRVALTSNRFEVHYQPQYRIKGGAITGFEALLRWRHPDRGLIPPSTFIPIAEQSTLIVQIGAWVLREACREAVRWPGHVSIAVNVSTIQLRDRRLVETVAAALEESRLPPDRLVLEVTETAVLHESPCVLQTMQDLRALGVHIALDDFGTGFSSLTHVQHFPIDRLKIDRSFVNGLGRDEKSLAIVRVVTTLAKSLGIPVTGEGVETKEQLATLAAEDCSDVQGWLYSQAVPAADALKLLRQSEPTRAGPYAA